MKEVRTLKVANPNLCEELYEISGWEGTALFHISGDDGYDTEFGDGWMPQDGGVSPAYDLGYLLRKLPTLPNYGAPYVGQSNNGDDYIASFMNWWAMWEYDGKGSSMKWHNEIVDSGFHKVADTPEDAVCELAIELFKQGILKRD